MPYSSQFGDHFYSRNDGRAECAHVFINGNRLNERFVQASSLQIGETGFGTGLNFVETWRQWKILAPIGATLRFTSFEKFPMQRDQIARALAHWPQVGEEANGLMAAWPEKPAGDISIDFGSIALEVLVGEACERLRDWKSKADAWFLDGFSPSRNPDMWSSELMEEVAAHSTDTATLATYSAAGWVRRNIQAAGFTVEKRPGFIGKRDMTVGWMETAKLA